MKLIKNDRLGKILKYFSAVCIWLTINLSILKIFQHYERQEADARRIEKRRRAFTAVISAVGLAFGGLALLQVVIKYIKRLRGGYLFDLFDRDKYDIIDPEADGDFGSAMRDELKRTDSDSEQHKAAAASVPVDEEATENDLG